MRKLSAILAAGLLGACLCGCSTDAEVPETPTVDKIAGVLESQLNAAEQACQAGTIGPQNLTALNSSVLFYRGHLAHEGKGTAEQLAALDDIHRRLVMLMRSGGIDPESESVRMNPADVEAIIAEIREVLKGIDAS